MWNASFKLMLSGCVVSMCCVGFASLDVVCGELNDSAGMLVCNSFLISVYVYCVESFAHIKCYSDCSYRGSHLVKPLCYGVI